MTAGATELVVVLVQDAAQEQLTSHVQPMNQANAHLRSVLNGARGDLRGYSPAADLSTGDAFDNAAAEYKVAVRELRTPATKGYRSMINTQVAYADSWWKVARAEREASPFDDQAINLAEASEPQFNAFADATDDLDARLDARAAALHGPTDLTR